MRDKPYLILLDEVQTDAAQIRKIIESTDKEMNK